MQLARRYLLIYFLLKIQVHNAYSLFLWINQPSLPYSDSKYKNSYCFLRKIKVIEN